MASAGIRNTFHVRFEYKCKVKRSEKQKNAEREMYKINNMYKIISVKLYIHAKYL